MKYCATCETSKNETEFAKSKKSRDGYTNKCKDCTNAYTRERYKKLNVQENEQLTRYLTNKLNYIKDQDAKKFPKHEFNLTVDDLKDIYLRQEGRCIYSNSKLGHGKDVSIYERISYDRLNNDLPHIKSNLQMTSVYMNMFKGKKTDEEFRILISNCQ